MKFYVLGCLLLISAGIVQPFVRSRQKYFLLAPGENILLTHQVPETTQLLLTPASNSLFIIHLLSKMPPKRIRVCTFSEYFSDLPVESNTGSHQGYGAGEGFLFKPPPNRCEERNEE